MAPKQKTTGKEERKGATLAVAEPQAKKPKVEAAVPAKEVEETEAAKPEEPEEKEIDAPADTRPGMKGTIGFDTSETTLNVIQTSGGRVLMPLTDGGMASLVAGARAGVGIKAGRYMFEVKGVESSPGGGQSQNAKQLLRVGFSIAASSLIFGDGDDSLYFDSDGGFYAGKKRIATLSKRFGRGSVVAVLLNLDPKTPNVNTVSLFIDGQRACAPQAIPDEIRGKSLFPHVCFRMNTIQVHFGPEPLRALPFKCRTIQSAAAADVAKAKVPAVVDGKHEVLYPIGFPDEGTFDWLDTFLEKNKQYVELSDRKIIDWAKKSGLSQKNPNGGSNDKPQMNLGVQGLDDLSASRIIKTVAPLVPRHYVVMEVKNNLVEAERAASLKAFPSRHFKKIAHVVMGEPNVSHKDLVKDKLLKAKQLKLDKAFQAAKAEKAKQKQIAQKQKEKQKKLDEAIKAQEAKKKAAEDKKKKEVGEAVEEKDAKEEEVKEEDKEETKEEESDDDGEPEKAVLTEEEANMWFMKGARSDLTNAVLDKSFGDFSIPAKSEGFDEIKYEWQKEKLSKEYLRNWVIERKRTSKIETLQPSEWFKQQQADFTKKLAQWQAQQKTAKAAPKRKKTDDGDEDEVGTDIFSIENVCDVGNGDPLFLDFEAHDWALMTLRWELHLMATAFKKDVNDPDREKIPEQHFQFYFSKYFKKSIQTKNFGKDTIKELVAALVKDTVTFDGEPCMFGSNLTEDAAPEMFVKLTEEKRRERQRRIDAGDETARLKFTPGGADGKKK